MISLTDTRKTEMALKLEVGKSYKNKLGEVVKIVRYDEERYFGFYDESEMNYTDEGVYSPLDTDSQYNLVEEN